MSKISFEYKGKPYTISIKNVGQENCSSRKKVEQRNRDYYSLHFVMFGFGSLLAKDKKYFLNKGNLFLLFTEEDYSYFPDTQDPWAYIWVDFYGENLDELFEDCGLTREKPFIRLNNYSNILEMLKQLYEKYDESDSSSVACCSYLTLIISQLLEIKGNLASKQKHSLATRQFKEVLLYVNNNYRMDLSLDQIADDMCISKRQLIYMFKLNVGMTPINYINKFRISNACLMLKNNYKISEISHMVGVNDEAYFARLFSKIMGISPSQYKSERKEDDPFLWLKEKGLDLR